MKIKLLFLLLIYFINFSMVLAQTLQGQINMSDQLPAISKKLCPGVEFKAKNLPSTGSIDGWDHIPSWAAGTFHRECQTNFLPSGSTNITTSRTMNDHQTGQQVDRQGGIWKYYKLPKIEIVETDNAIDYQIINENNTVWINDNKLLVQGLALAICVNKTNGKIAKAYQAEQFEYIIPEGSGRIFEDVYIRIFDQNGNLQRSQHSQAHDYLIRPFIPIDFDPDTKVDLRQSLKNYLIFHGLQDLVPGE